MSNPIDIRQVVSRDGVPVYASWRDTLIVVLLSLSLPTEDDWCPVRRWDRPTMDVQTGAHLQVMMATGT